MSAWRAAAVALTLVAVASCGGDGGDGDGDRAGATSTVPGQRPERGPGRDGDPTDVAEPPRADDDVEPGATGRFRTSGHHIVGPDGYKFVPIGGNVTAEPYPPAPSSSWWSTEQRFATGKSDEALAWGWNFVRVSVSTSGEPEVSLDQQFEGVFRLIDEYTSKRIVVAASLWDFMGENPTWAEVEANPHVLRLQDELVARYRDNPYVWLYPLNEPFDYEYEEGWADIGTRLYDRARGQGWDGIFVWDLPSYGQFIQAAAETSMATDFLAGKRDVVIGWHNYGAGDDELQHRWAEQVIERGIPIAITEFGQHWDPDDRSNELDEGERRGANWTLDNVWRYGFGAVVWHASAASYNQYALRMATGSAWWSYPDAPPLSEVGERLYAIGTGPRPRIAIP